MGKLCFFGCLFLKLDLYIVLSDGCPSPSIYIQHVFEHTKNKAHSCLPHSAFPILNVEKFSRATQWQKLKQKAHLKKSSLVPFGKTLSFLLLFC